MNPEGMGGQGDIVCQEAKWPGYVQIVKRWSELVEFSGMLQVKLFVLWWDIESNRQLM